MNCAETIELEWTLPDGRVEREVRPLPEKDGVAVFSLTRDEIVSRGASSVAMTPTFARARKGDDGFWVFSSGECGTYRCDDGVAECSRWQLMSVFGMKTPERTFAAIVRKLKYYFTTRVVAKDGEYRMSCVLGEELCRAPYEDFEIEFRRLEGGEATMGGIARAYRNYQLARGAVRPLRERAAENAVLKAAIDGPEIRIRQAWKPVPPSVLEQTPETEPPVTAHVTFDRVADIARALKAAGVGHAELCLVGWNIGGHDGRWPQAFPAEQKLGGDEKLKACVKTVRDLGCATDAELADSVAKIKEGADIYARLSPLQYEYMEEHDSLGGGVWRTTYSDGTRVYVNYAKSPATADGLDIPAEGWRVNG